MEEYLKYTDTKGIKAFLDGIDRLAFPLLRWIITRYADYFHGFWRTENSNRAHLARLEPKDRITDMITEYQYMFLSSPPEKESKFQKLKKEKGSFWAFQYVFLETYLISRSGSGFSNWHSILRIGLKNYSKNQPLFFELTFYQAIPPWWAQEPPMELAFIYVSLTTSVCF